MKKGTQNIIIIILLVIIVVIAIFQIIKLSQSAKSESLFKSLLEIQINVSEYLGKMNEETYGAYTKEQILIGSSDLNNIKDTIIKDYKNNNIINIVNYSEKVTKDEVNFYKINNDNIKKVLNVEVNNELDVDFYISGKGKITVKYNNMPAWWINEFNTISIN